MNRSFLSTRPVFPAATCIFAFAVSIFAAGNIGDLATSGPSASSEPASRTVPPATTQPITVANTPAAKLLKQWWAEGTAAGNVGDWYDNRDRGHSDLRTADWPQLQRIVYDEQAKANRTDWAAQRTIIPKVVFGNSSTSAGVTSGGSNIRMYYNNPNGLAFLFTEYTRNNIYMYPEHRDHDPGHNGFGDGYGDVFCTNTPFLIGSQGSSGSDQPFMRAVANTLAAFRPEVKKKLIETGLLMPTVQLILRSTLKPVEKPEDYLTGKAHPTIFEGAGVDDVKMVEMAHAMTLDNLPPMSAIKAIKEDAPAVGTDPSEPGRSEKLIDTPVVIARIWRGNAYTRTMTVTAEPSFDLNKQPLTYHWVLLRGDPERVTISTDKTGKTAEITVKYPYRRPIAKNSSMESNRVDIGVFVNNGTYYSPPSFITFYGLDNEARTYDSAGRLLDIGYDACDTVIDVHWPAMFDLLAPDNDKPAGKFIREKFDKPRLDGLQKLSAEIKPACDAALAAKKKFDEAQSAARKAADEVKAVEAKIGKAGTPKTAQDKSDLDKLAKDLQAARDAQKSADTASRDAQKKYEEASKAVDAAVAKKRDELGGSAKEIVDAVLNAMLNDPDFCRNNDKMIQSLLTDKAREFINAERKRLFAYGLIKDLPDQIVFESILHPGVKLSDPIPPPAAGLPATAPADSAGKQFTRYELCNIRKMNGIILGGLIFTDAITASCCPNYVDMLIGSPKAVREVFKYDASGKRTAVIRYDGKTRTELAPDSPPAGK